ncbi:type I DNA topoisomerase [Aquipuribacter sp. MA13-6]|uniref:type I DNA topoisomerase n=1 Tax=Aquipuribacter sp. MA13-6 TaxID=3440839 RepID=UPI003EEA145B
MARSSSPTSRALVIVESPAKAKTIGGYLGDGYVVEASVGHIRDLPQPSELPPEMKKGPYGKFAVDVSNGFEPYYVVDADKKKKVTELKRALKDVDELILATDEDREGEAIAWHLLEELKPKVPVKRMVFHEITREAIARALEATRDIDENMVDAQETRRILDRLYGYEVSPVLWRKVRQGLSAGRVQSVATRLVVQRERERMAFVAADYASVSATFSAPGDRQQFSARLTSLDGARVATGRDFDDLGRLKNADVAVLDVDGARTLVAAMSDAEFSVTRVEEKPYTRKPAAPFTTSTLQQEASRKLRLSSKDAMRVAQSLYEGGYITYMRTDSTSLSATAVQAARSQAKDLYGADSVPASPRTWAGKSKNAQEAHEAIRPAGDSFRTPAQVAGSVRGAEFRLYELIWQRTVASQMADARGTTASVRIGARTSDDRTVELSASGTVITFRGFLSAYEEGRDADRDDARTDGETENRLPKLEEGGRVDAEDVATAEHRTSPPSRYTEASLVKALEERGIGRPSTYAATIGTIIDRGYVRHKGNALVPEWLAFAVTRLLEEHFPRLVDYDFTAEMEADLDRVAAGEVAGSDWLARFYFGASGPEGADGTPAAGLPPLPGGAGQGLTGLAEGLKGLAEELGDIDARAVSTIELGEGLVLRVGRYGPYLQDENASAGADGKEVRAGVPDDIAPDELTVARARELIADAAKGDTVLGQDPDTGHDVIVKSGRFGPFVAEVLPEDSKDKPRRASLLSTMTIDTVTLDDALRLLSLPRVVGVDPSSEEEITAQNGRYGPYLKKGTDSRSLDTEEQMFTVTLEEALAVYAQPKRGRGGRAAPAPLKELGVDPVSEKPITVRSGRFGDYVSDGETNATLRGADSTESITFERAVELLSDRRAAGPAKKRGAKKTAAKKTSAKKTTAKKTAAKKTTATTTAAKKTAAKKTTATTTAAKKTAATRTTAGTAPTL